tara:strand:+ start:311 stop:502 length:192 start_codon:yes stop_codon:yes gene_type:complete
MKLSDQALGAIMMALQKCLMEQVDIVPILREMDLEAKEIQGSEELVVNNPPVVQADLEQLQQE